MERIEFFTVISGGNSHTFLPKRLSENPLM